MSVQSLMLSYLGEIIIQQTITKPKLDQINLCIFLYYLSNKIFFNIQKKIVTIDLFVSKCKNKDFKPPSDCIDLKKNITRTSK